MSTNTVSGYPDDDQPDDAGTASAEVVPFPGRGPDGDDPERPAAESDTSYEIALDDDPDAGPEPVDDGIGYVLDDEPDAYPVIPEHLRSMAGIGHEMARHLRKLGHRAAFHGVRAPVYLVRVTWRAGVGAFRTGGRQLAWWWMPETEELKSVAVANRDSREYTRLHKLAGEARLLRGIVVATEAAGLLAAGGLLATVAPWWAQLAAASVAVPLLARAGRPDDDRPIISAATTEPRFRVISADVVLRAYYAAGLGDPDKPGQRITFESSMARDGDGSKVRVVLPYGTGFGDVVKALPKLASGLDVAPSQVYLTADKTSHRRHTLWVADRDPLAIPAGRTPLLDCKPRSIWQPAPVGRDERGRLVTLLLLWISVLIGAQPRKGKTFAGRLLALYAALDATVRMSIVDGKDSPDWKAFRSIAYHYIHGVTPGPDGDPAQQLIAALDEIKEHVEQTNAFLSTLPDTECPEGKITEELCRKYPKRLFPWFLVMEEFQKYFELPDQKQNATIADRLAVIQAVGPSAGVVIVSLSQKPSGVGAGDVQRLFNRYRDLHAVRIALRCGNRNVSDAVLGGDAYAEGYDASALPKESKGVGYLYGAADDTPTVRFHLAEGPDAAKIVAAARVIRERAGTIAGYAAGVEVAADAADILADARQVFGADNGLHWDVLADRLARQFPQRHADANAESVSAACRARSIPSVAVRYPSGRTGRIRQGCRRADLDGPADGT